MVVWCTQNVRRDGSSFTWHVATAMPLPNNVVSTPLPWVFKTCYERLQSLSHNHMRQNHSESARERSIIMILLIKQPKRSLQMKTFAHVYMFRLLVWPPFKLATPPVMKEANTDVQQKNNLSGSCLSFF